MTRLTAASALQPAERFAELAELLAAGVQRLFAAQCKHTLPLRIVQDPLDVQPAVEAPCRLHALNPQSRAA